MKKELFSQLNNIKNIKADSDWKMKSREILLSQISGSFSLEKESAKQSGFSFYFKNFLHQPVMVVAAVLIAVFGGGTLSIYASSGTKPGDSLYIAKIISEKAQLAITFDETEKAKLNIEFAKNRAKEISQVLENNSNEDKKAATVEKLSNSFKKEIYASKERLGKTNLVNNDNSEVFSANVGRSDQGIEIYDIKEDGQAGGGEVIIDDNVSTTPVATSSEEVVAIHKAGVNEVLDEAEKLFFEQNYSEVLNKLDEVGAIINKSTEDKSSADVLGEKELSATSTN